MSTTFVGTTAFTEQPGAQLTVDAWGMDTLVRKYKGSRTLLPAFLATYAKSRAKVDSEYTWLSHQSHSADIDRAYATVSVQFKGIQGSTNSGGIGLPPVRDTVLKTQEVQLQYIGDTLGQSTGAVANITYVAPSTTIRYVRRGRPKKQSFKGDLELTEEAISIVARNGFPGSIQLFAGATWKRELKDSGSRPSLTPVGAIQAYNGVIEVITTQFSFTPAGLWYECVEVNEARVVPLDLANGLINFFL